MDWRVAFPKQNPTRVELHGGVLEPKLYTYASTITLLYLSRPFPVSTFFAWHCGVVAFRVGMVYVQLLWRRIGQA